jgi:hypothetical protein
MYHAREEGLGLSLVVYALLMAAALTLIITPVLWASGPTEYVNPQLPKYDITSSRPLAHQQKQIPLARLKREEIVDAKMLASINTKPAKSERVREARSERPSRAARTAFAQAPDHDEAPRQRRGLFGWSLF